MGEPTGEATVADAQRELDAAKAAFGAATEDARLVDAEIARATELLDAAARARSHAIVAVLSAAPEPAAAIERYHQLMNQAAAIRKALNGLPVWSLPQNWDARPFKFQPDGQPAEKWQQAVQALERDASAPLPSLDPPPAEAA